MEAQAIDWQRIRVALSAPFAPEQIDFRVQGGKPFARDGKQYGRVVAYIDSRTVAERLDDVVGPGAWSFDWEPLAMDKAEVVTVKGTLTIHGVGKADIGDAGETERSKAAVSDALKRAAVLWGIGRYLYDLGTFYGQVTVSGERITGLASGAIGELRAKLPRSGKASLKAVQAPEPEEETAPAPSGAYVPPVPAKISPAQIEDIQRLCQEGGFKVPADLFTWTMEKANTTLRKMRKPADGQKAG